MTRRRLLGLSVVSVALAAAGCEGSDQPASRAAQQIRPTPTPTAVPPWAFALPTASPTRPVPTATLLPPSATAAPSRRPGTRSWVLASNKGTIKGFLDRISAADGDTLGLYVTTPARTFDVEVYRMGWYDGGGSQAELVQAVRGVAATEQPAPRYDRDTGLVSCSNWKRTTEIKVAGWRTGLYLLKLVAADKDDNFVTLVVRDDVGKHDVLFVHSANTDQAYNGFGGKSLYDFNSTQETTVGGSLAAVKVSFDRPLDRDGSGHNVLPWELNMVRWLEASGFDVAYASDLEVHQNPTFDGRFKAVVMAGHPEYWSMAMRNNLEAARDRGTGLGFFTGDTGSWAVRYEDSPLGRDRVMVSYKDAGKDPLAPYEPQLATPHFYEPPLRRPPHLLFGLGTNALVKRSADWRVEGAARLPKLFEGTGFKDGDVVPNLVGYEYDGMWTPGSPPEPLPDLQVVGRARVLPTRPLTSNLTAWYTLAPEQQPLAARLATRIDPGTDWAYGSFYVGLAWSAGKAFLQYRPGAGTPTRTRGQADYLIHPLGPDFEQAGWRALERDLLADYAALAGPPPEDLRVTGVIARGPLALTEIDLTRPDGGRTTLGLDPTTKTEGGWRIEKGRMAIEPVGPGGKPALVTRPPKDERREDDAHTVAIKTKAGGAIVAVGSIQWSWGLDDYGKHTDAQGNETRVDPRLQALTKNMVRALIGEIKL